MVEEQHMSFSVGKVPLTGWNSVNDVTKEGSDVFQAPQYASMSRVGPFLYMAGTICEQVFPHRRSSNVIALLDVVLEEWRWIPYDGSFAQGAGMFLFEDSLYSLGPMDWMRDATGNISRFDLALEEWSYCHTLGEGPGPRAYFSGHFIEPLRRFVVFGGLGTADMNDVHLLDIPEWSWCKAKAKGAAPQGRFQHGSCIYKGIIYIYGGWTEGARCNDELYLLEVGKGKSVRWSSPQTNAMGFGTRSSFAFIPLGRVLLLCGGFSNMGAENLSFYDPDIREFKDVELGDELLSHFGSGSCAISIEDGGAIALFGGLSHLRSYTRISTERVV